MASGGARLEDHEMDINVRFPPLISEWLKAGVHIRELLEEMPLPLLRIRCWVERQCHLPPLERVQTKGVLIAIHVERGGGFRGLKE